MYVYIYIYVILLACSKIAKKTIEQSNQSKSKADIHLRSSLTDDTRCSLLANY